VQPQKRLSVARLRRERDSGEHAIINHCARRREIALAETVKLTAMVKAAG